MSFTCIALSILMTKELCVFTCIALLVFYVLTEELSAVRVELKESEEWHQEEEERLKRFIDEADDELDQCRRDLTRTESEWFCASDNSLCCYCLPACQALDYNIQSVYM